VNQTFYTALFSDSALKNRVSDIKALVLKNAYTTEVTFTDLPYGTYYVGETDAAGTPITSSNTVSKVEITDGKAILSQPSPGASAIIKNTMKEGVLGEYVSVDLTVKKNVVDANGKDLKVNDTFYFAVFTDREFTYMLRGTTVQKLTLNNASSGSVSFNKLPYTDAIYIAETDKNGNVVTGSADFKYTVSYNGNGMSYARADGGTITVTNKAKEGKFKGDNRQPENRKNSNTNPNGTNASAGRQQSAVRTGDQTPVLPLMITMIIAAAAVVFLVLFRKRLKRKN
jgi:hypothetical protein